MRPTATCPQAPWCTARVGPHHHYHSSSFHDYAVLPSPRAVVHVVDWALVPFFPTVESLAGGAGGGGGVDPAFSILHRLALAEGTCITAALSGEPFSVTFFAPTNA